MATRAASFILSDLNKQVMKTFLCVFSLLLFAVPGLSQYTVTKVVGNVTNKITGDKISMGHKLNDNDQLGWSSDRDMIRAIVAGKGVFIISPSPKAQQEPNAFVEMVKTSLKIKAKGGYLSGRAENGAAIPASLETEPKVNDKNLFLAENTYVFDKGEYKVSDGSAFFLQIEHAGAPPIIRRLRTRGDTLIILASDFNVPEGAPADGVKYKLGFFSKEAKTSRSLINIKPAFDSSSAMETIIRLVIAESQEADTEKLKEACYAEVYEALGKPSEIQFNDLFYKLTSIAKKS
jgi:hypothetical protein